MPNNKPKSRKGAVKNPNGTESTHLMMREYVDGRGWVAFPSLFQDDDGKWYDLSKAKNWGEVYEFAKSRGEVYDFGEDVQAAIDFADKGSWKTPKYQQGGPPSLEDLLSGNFSSMLGNLFGNMPVQNINQTYDYNGQQLNEEDYLKATYQDQLNEEYKDDTKTWQYFIPGGMGLINAGKSLWKKRKKKKAQEELDAQFESGEIFENDESAGIIADAQSQNITNYMKSGEFMTALQALGTQYSDIQAQTKAQNFNKPVNHQPYMTGPDRGFQSFQQGGNIKKELRNEKPFIFDWLESPAALQRVVENYPGYPFKWMAQKFLNSGIQEMDETDLYYMSDLKNLKLSTTGDNMYKLTDSPNIGGQHFGKYNTIMINDKIKYPGTVIHEATHASGNLQRVTEDLIKDKFKVKSFEDWINETTKRGYDDIFSSSDKSDQNFLTRKKKKYDYLIKDGMYPRVFEAREYLKMNPDEKFTKDHLLKIKRKSFYKDMKTLHTDDEIIDIMNTVADSDQIDASEFSNDIQVARYGGSIKKQYGGPAYTYVYMRGNFRDQNSLSNYADVVKEHESFTDYQRKQKTNQGYGIARGAYQFQPDTLKTTAGKAIDIYKEMGADIPQEFYDLKKGVIKDATQLSPEIQDELFFSTMVKRVKKGKGYALEITPSLYKYDINSPQGMADFWQLVHNRGELDQRDKFLESLERYRNFKLKKGQMGMSVEGYRNNSPDKYNAMNRIPGGVISMDNVSVPLLLKPSNGQAVIAQPNSGTYKFPMAEYVDEIPLGKYGGMMPIFQGGGFVEDWLKDPATRQRIIENYPDIATKYGITMEEAADTVLSEADKKLLETKVYTIQEIQNKTAEELGNDALARGVSIDDGTNNNPPNPKELGEYIKDQKNRTSIASYNDNTGVIITDNNNSGDLAHEKTHVLGNLGKWTERYIQETYNPKHKTFKDYLKNVYGSDNSMTKEEYYDYIKQELPEKLEKAEKYWNYVDEDGMYPRIFQARDYLKMKPGDVFTEDHLNKIKGKEYYEDLSERYTDKQIIDMFNTVADNSSKEEETQIAKYGGMINKFQQGGDVGQLEEFYRLMMLLSGTDMESSIIENMIKTNSEERKKSRKDNKVKKAKVSDVSDSPLPKRKKEDAVEPIKEIPEGSIEIDDIPGVILPESYTPQQFQQFSNDQLFKAMKNFQQGGQPDPNQPVPVQTEKGETVMFPDGTITNVKAKKKHKGMKDDEVTDILPPGSYVFSNDKNLKVDKKIADEISFGYGPTTYSEKQIGKAPREMFFGEVLKKKQETPATVSKNIKRMFPITDMENDVYADRANEENKLSRAPFLAMLKKINDDKRAMMEQQNFQYGGSPTMNNIYRQPPVPMGPRPDNNLVRPYARPITVPMPPKAQTGMEIAAILGAIPGIGETIGAVGGLYQNYKAQQRVQENQAQTEQDLDEYYGRAMGRADQQLGIEAGSAFMQAATQDPTYSRLDVQPLRSRAQNTFAGVRQDMQAQQSQAQQMQQAPINTMYRSMAGMDPRMAQGMADAQYAQYLNNANQQALGYASQLASLDMQGMQTMNNIDLMDAQDKQQGSMYEKAARNTINSSLAKSLGQAGSQYIGRQGQADMTRVAGKMGARNQTMGAMNNLAALQMENWKDFGQGLGNSTAQLYDTWNKYQSQQNFNPDDFETWNYNQKKPSGNEYDPSNWENW